MSKHLLFVVTLILISATAYLTWIFNTNYSKTAPKKEVDTAVNQAKLLYKHEKEKGRDLSNGPCLSDALMPNWVLDIAHRPRLPIDDLPQNQCPAYTAGKAQHFVELDPDGNLIKAR